MVADTLHKHLFTSTDCGLTFIAHDLEFVPELVEFDKAHDKLFLVHDLEDTEKRLYVTKNFGETFSHVQVSCAFVFSYIVCPASNQYLVLHISFTPLTSV